MLSKLIPGQLIEDHRDNHDGRCRIRIHVPLKTNPNAIFRVETHTTHMAIGHAYQIDPTQLHSTWNHGDEDRIHLIFNMAQ